ncbi:MAG: immunity 53 family protein [Rhizobium sp.]|nr:immunity 53 family protein [Rhizobium sp.]
MDAVSKLCAWYELQCVDDWHEDHGIKIGTLDNPGWSMKIDLEGTALCERPFQEIQIERTDRDWVFARKDGSTFEAFGGPMALDEMIKIFLAWAE